MDFDPRDYADSRDRDDDRIYGSWLGQDPREPGERNRTADPREHDPRDPFVEGLDLPRGLEREYVRDGHGDLYELNGDDARLLATVGAFRVASERDLEHCLGAADSLNHLREERLTHSVQVGPDARAEVLTERGRDVLEESRRDRDGDGQAFYAEVGRPRELQHDAQLFRAYLKVEEGIHERGGSVDRVVLEVDLRREYQQWLQEHNRDRPDSDGRPDRDADEIEGWALRHDLPYFDESVHFPDFRVEYELEGREQHEDVEVITGHYRGAHAASRAKSGFSCFRSGGNSKGGSTFDPDFAKDFL